MSRRYFEDLLIDFIADADSQPSFMGGQISCDALVAGWANLQGRRHGEWGWAFLPQEYGEDVIRFRCRGIRITRRDVEQLAQMLLPRITDYTVILATWETDEDDWQVRIELFPHYDWNQVVQGRHIEEGHM